MQALVITTVQTPVPGPGDFGAVVKGQMLAIPQCVADCYGSQIGTAVGLVSLAQSFPSCFMDGLGWTKPEVDAALNKLCQQLVGLVHPDILNPPPRPQVSFGALPPPTLLP